MAISKNMWLKGASQRLGGVVLYQARGETRMRELAPSVSNPRTEGQMTQRVKLANLVNFYRASKGWMQRAFEVKPNNNSDYNRFVSLNLTNNRIYLTKQEANAGACIVDAYRVTEGTLPSVEVSKDGENWITNIYMGNVTEILPRTTVSEFATTILQANAGLQAGDQISFIRLSQQTNPNTGVPYMIVRAYEVLLNVGNPRPLGDYLPLDYFRVGQIDEANALGITNSGNAGGFVLIVSRTSGSTIAVSSQDVIVANNEALINSHSSEVAKQTAIDSYGQGDEVFLSSATAGTIGQQVVPLALLSITDFTDIWVSGEIGPNLVDVAEAEMAATFNQVIEGSTINVSLEYFDNNNNRVDWGQVTGNAEGYRVEFTAPVASGAINSYKLAYIAIVIDGVTYSFEFSDGSLG